MDTKLNTANNTSRPVQAGSPHRGRTAVLFVVLMIITDSRMKLARPLTPALMAVVSGIFTCSSSGRYFPAINRMEILANTAVDMNRGCLFNLRQNSTLLSTGVDVCKGTPLTPFAGKHQMGPKRATHLML